MLREFRFIDMFVPFCPHFFLSYLNGNFFFHFLDFLLV